MSCELDVTNVTPHATGQLPGQAQSRRHWTATCPWCDAVVTGVKRKIVSVT